MKSPEEWAKMHTTNPEDWPVLAQMISEVQQEAITEATQSALPYARMNDSTVNSYLEGGCGAGSLIALLVRQKRDLMNRIAELDCMRPRKIRHGGKLTYIWHCPDDLIPEEEV